MSDSSHAPTPDQPKPKAHGGHFHAPGQDEMEIPEGPHEHLNMLIAVTVALISTYMAGIHIANENTVIEMHHAEVSALDTWNQYQAKRQREYIATVSRTQLAVVGKAMAGGGGKPIDDQLKRFDDDIQKYQKDEKEISEKAKGLEEAHEKLAKAHDGFDVADAAIAVCLSILAVTALTGKNWLLWVAWAFAGLGVLAGLWGLTHTHILAL